jgi:hypothetical protein
VIVEWVSLNSNSIELFLKKLTIAMSEVHLKSFVKDLCNEIRKSREGVEDFLCLMYDVIREEFIFEIFSYIF